MAGLEELIAKEQTEEAPQASVPRSEQEAYDPNPLRGVAGIALAGAGAVALRTPLGRALNKISKLRTPKAPATRVTEPVDQVDEVLTIAPTKIERGQAMRLPQISQQEQIRQEAIARSNELKKIAYQAPLSRGGKTNRIGSSLWDYIARHPIAGARKPEDWIRDFKSGGPGSFKTGNPEFKNISQAVKKEELWDSNLVQFDKNGNLVGGFLKVAQEKKIPLTKMDLLYIVEKAPVNNLKMRKLTTNIQTVDDSDKIYNSLNLGLQNIRDKAVATSVPATRSEELSQLVKDVNDTQKSLRKINARMYNQFRSADHSEYDDVNQLFDSDIQAFKNLADKARQLGIAVDTQEVTRVADAAKTMNTDIIRKLGLQKTQGMLPKYGNHDEYRVRGGDEYFENVVYYPKQLPMGQRLPDEYNRHYVTSYGDTKPIPNQIYHTRGSIRSGGDAPNQKVMLIDEIQSDYHQKLRNVNPARDKVVNAFGTEIEFFSANRKLEKMINEMKDISKKGIKMTKDDMIRFNTLKSDFDNLKGNSLNLANITKNEARDGIPFLPLYGKENWGTHAIKNQIKDAVDRGVNWVAITPVENLHHAKRTRYLGDIEFYGTRTGKAGFPNYGSRDGVVRKNSNQQEVPIDGLTNPNKTATLPSAMQKIAREYNSIVKTIPVAKSDPSKPYKVIKRHNSNKKFGLPKDNGDVEHIAAFKTRDEAEYYAGRYGGDTVEMLENDPRLYFEAFAIKVSPEMASKPFKAYNTGGLVVNIFA